MYLALDILGIAVFLLLGWALSDNRRAINWMSVGIMTVLNIVIAWLLTSFSWGRAAVQVAAQGFTEVIKISYKGINFAIGNWVGPTGVNPAPVNFIVSSLLPILLIVPLFDTLSYIGFLPWVIKWIGRGLSFITRQPKFESFYAIEMMFLGCTEALAVSKVQLQKTSKERNLSLAMMSMSCVSASIIGSYIQMIPGQFVLTAIPLNCINALIVVGMLHPVEVKPEEDVIYKIDNSEDVNDAIQEAADAEAGVVAETSDAAKASETAKVVETSDTTDAKPAFKARVAKFFHRDPNKPQKEPYFSFLSDSLLGAGKLVLIITATVITFVAMTGLIDKLLGLIWAKLSLESILGVIMYIPSLLLGLDPATAWSMSQIMGLKLVTNEFVAMGEVTKTIATFAPHYQAVLAVFLTSFANFGTLGMITGLYQGIVDKEKNYLIGHSVGRIMLSGILVSLLSAGMAGLFVW
ncbi:nucleoside transporter C-terminal domain-containing protein [Bifidobacterium sp. ESL0764]|uniref:nucleoside transporter C-terminal domain-containing protein n=1 Tax=Bifidobacterium sp. ESL0764 TaxID=2983228 RepID=UPI0023F7CDD8|nr:nucleoside transporter C-terminal domain-containing protein [Bifidobacterium sp. ESL0764]WEV65682.1 nucleoside transporter [Bifidobacterium sp. ESL0764]